MILRPGLPPRLTVGLRVIAARLDGAPVRWWVSGSAASRLRGNSRRPNDLDIECPVGDANQIADALGIVVEPCRDSRVHSIRGQGTVAGAPVDLTAGYTPIGPDITLPADDDLIFRSCSFAKVCGWPVRIMPAEEAVVRALVHADLRRAVRAAAEVDGGLDLSYVSRRLSCAMASR